MMKRNPQTMTNRELHTSYEAADEGERYTLMVEMARRINRKLITPDVLQIFKQYKLNGAGDQYD